MSNRTNEISNSDKVIDSRDVIARIDYLKGELADLTQEVENARAALEESQEARERLPCEGDGQAPNSASSADYELAEKADECAAELTAAQTALKDWHDSSEGEELLALLELADEGETCGDWHHGATLIHEDYFTDYCVQLVQDIGDLPHNIPGYLVIDWEATADNLRQDYTSIDFGGVTYFVR